jgi:hypothetical protein
MLLLVASPQVIAYAGTEHDHLVLLKKVVVHVRRCGYDFMRLCPKQVGTTL